jgi:hypothetical protein
MAAMPRLLGAHYAALQAYAARMTNARSGRAGR